MISLTDSKNLPFNEIPPILCIDNGSYEIRCQLSNSANHKPIINKTVYGTPKSALKHLATCMIPNIKETYIGPEIQQHRAILSLRYPVEHGVISNWDGMEAIWSHLLTSFKPPKSSSFPYPTLLSESPMNFAPNRQKTFEIMFETFEIPSFALIPAPILSSRGKDAVVVDIGDTATHIVSIRDGYLIPSSYFLLLIGGRSITTHLFKSLQRSISPEFSINFQDCQEIKEELGRITVNPFLAEDPEAEENLFWDKWSDTNPLLAQIPLSKHIYSSAEPLFNPCILGISNDGIHDLVSRSVRKADIQETRKRPKTETKILLVGGTSRIHGLVQRLENQIIKLGDKVFANTTLSVSTPQIEISAPLDGALELVKVPSFVNSNFSSSQDYFEGEHGDGDHNGSNLVNTPKSPYWKV